MFDGKVNHKACPAQQVCDDSQTRIARMFAFRSVAGQPVLPVAGQDL